MNKEKEGKKRISVYETGAKKGEKEEGKAKVNLEREKWDEPEEGGIKEREKKEKMKLEKLREGKRIGFVCRTGTKKKRKKERRK